MCDSSCLGSMGPPGVSGVSPGSVVAAAACSCQASFVP